MKCILCGKEFLENISDFDLVQHFINEHKKETQDIGKSILVVEKNKKKRLIKNGRITARIF